jgi:hypothetical protein
VRPPDPLDWIHAVTAHIPDRGRHCVRYTEHSPTAPDRRKTSSEQQTAPYLPPAVLDFRSWKDLQQTNPEMLERLRQAINFAVRTRQSPA